MLYHSCDPGKSTKEFNRVVLNSLVDVGRVEDIEPWMLVPMPAFDGANLEASESNDEGSVANN